MNLFAKLLLLVPLIAVLASSDARAATISFSGAFTSYNGQVGGCGSFETFINGADVTPASGCDPMSQTAPLSMVLGGSNSVAFFGNQFGVGQLEPNGLRFEGAQDVPISALGDEVLLGRLFYTNGTWFGSEARFEFELTSTSSDAAFNSHTLVDTIVLEVTPTLATNTPDDNADFVYLQNFRTIGTLRAFEKFDSPTGLNGGSAELYGRISSIIPTRFANAEGGAFVGSGVDQPPPPAPVPEPGTLALLGSGVAALVARRRRVQRRS
jgi:hypothetical protein